jgi:opacity protein-like surface antigen
VKFSLVAVVAILFATNAFAKTEGSYAGFDFVETNIEAQEKPASNYYYSGKMSKGLSGIGAEYKYAINFDDIFLAPGMFGEYNDSATRVDRADGVCDNNKAIKVKERYGAKLDLGYDFTEEFSSYLTVGYSNIAYRTRNWVNDPADVKNVNGNRTSIFYGIGMRREVDEDFSVALEANFQESFTAKTSQPNALSFKANVDIFKVVAFLHF